MVFHDRLDAGRRLATTLRQYRELPKAVVLGIPRGGVVIANAIARELQLPLGICPVRKVGAPGNPELALGAVDDTEVLVYDRRLTRHLGIDDEELRLAARRTRDDLVTWLAGMGPGSVPSVDDRTVILTDDGIATGYTAQAGVQSVRRRGAQKVVLAAPVAPPETAEWLSSQVDDLVCLETPEPFYAVGNFFEEWPQVTDDQVRSLLLAGNTL